MQYGKFLAFLTSDWSNLKTFIQSTCLLSRRISTLEQFQFDYRVRNFHRSKNQIEKRVEFKPLIPKIARYRGENQNNLYIPIKKDCYLIGNCGRGNGLRGIPLEFGTNDTHGYCPRACHRRKWAGVRGIRIGLPHPVRNTEALARNFCAPLCKPVADGPIGRRFRPLVPAPFSPSVIVARSTFCSESVLWSIVNKARKTDKSMGESGKSRNLWW
jgi:hypothetical protein